MCHFNILLSHVIQRSVKFSIPMQPKILCYLLVSPPHNSFCIVDSEQMASNYLVHFCCLSVLPALLWPTLLGAGITPCLNSTIVNVNWTCMDAQSPNSKYGLVFVLCDQTRGRKNASFWGTWWNSRYCRSWTRSNAVRLLDCKHRDGNICQ